MKENFNISIGKLKKFFKAKYLLELLKSQDAFAKILEVIEIITRQTSFFSNSCHDYTSQRT